MDLSYMKENYESVRARMDAARAKVGNPDVSLIAAVKEEVRLEILEGDRYTATSVVKFAYRIFGVVGVELFNKHFCADRHVVILLFLFILFYQIYQIMSSDIDCFV